MNSYKKIIAICPGNTVTGGPEAMHFLVHSLREIGLNAEICYLPFDQNFSTPESYNLFNIKISNYEDASGNLIIFPETFPMHALRVKNAQAAIWWLSVDHYSGYKHENLLRDKFNYFKLVLKGLRPAKGLSSLKNILHFSQSHYSSQWLSTAGMKSKELFEPINQEYILHAKTRSRENRSDRILYNPSKGKKIVNALIKSHPSFEFIPLTGMNRSELISIYSTSKIYIDFGHHPGRDRIPREATVLGCCLITSQMGSAKNSVDIPIANTYKLDINQDNFSQSFGSLASTIFNNFHYHYEAQESYRLRILNEPKFFEDCLKNIFL